MFQHNRRLQQFITSADQKIAKATQPQDLLEIIEETRRFQGNFQFDQRDYLLYFGLDAALLIGGFFLFKQSDEGFGLFLIILSLFLATHLLFRYCKRRNHVDRLSAHIYQRDLLFDNQLTIINTATLTPAALASRFSDFQRGNYSRKIETLLEGQYQAPLSFTYRYYHFHYIDKREERSTDHQGKTTTTTHFDHHDRYGLIIDLRAIKTLTFHPLVKITHSSVLWGFNKGDYAPASLKFRKNFKLQTQDPMQAAKFLTPVMVETLELMLDKFQNIVLEINSHQELLLSFSNPELLSANRQYSLLEIDLFLQEISQITPLPNLVYTLNIIDKILQEMDHNFS